MCLIMGNLYKYSEGPVFLYLFDFALVGFVQLIINAIVFAIFGIYKTFQTYDHECDYDSFSMHIDCSLRSVSFLQRRLMRF